jgi:hypothetical protein
MAKWRATHERQTRTNNRKHSSQKESGRTLVRPLCEITKTSRNPKLIALPQYEAAQIIYFVFVFAFFFFFAAMMVILDVCVMNLRQGWFSQVDLRSRSLGFSPLTEGDNDTPCFRTQSKNGKKPLFFRSLTVVQVSINQRSAT